jgi:hypothetical protein
MLRSHLAIAGCATAMLLIYAGCSGSTEKTVPPIDQTGRIPPPPGENKPGDGMGVVLAVDRLFLGETDREGNDAAKDGWKEYGYNLDGRISTPDSTDLCQPVMPAKPSAVYPDGMEGIDNSFGKNILPIVTSLTASPSAEVSQTIQDGDFTVIVKIDNLGPDPDYNPLTSRLYVGASLGMPPVWDGTDAWPVVQEFLDNPSDINSSKVIFESSYLVSNTWVSGDKATLNLDISVAGYSLTLPITNALITMDLDPDHKGAINGTIAGVLPTEEFISELQKVIGAFDETLCSGSTVEGILQQIRQASDILKDGTQDPGKTCDGISLGIGFTAREIQLGDIAPPSPAQPNPCDPGMGGAGGAGMGGAGGAGGAGGSG